MLFALLIAAECGDGKRVANMLLRFPDLIGKTDYRNRTALHLAVEHGHLNVVDVLIAHGINLAAKDCAGFTALHLAVELGHDKIVARLLEERPALIGQRTHDHELTCLHLAIIKGHVTIVKQLLEIQREVCVMALHFAVEYGQGEIVATLMESVRSTGSNKDMLQNAMRFGYAHIASQILAQNPHLVDTIDSSMSALHLAAENGCVPVVTQLLVAKPDLIEVGRWCGRGVLQIMAEHGYDKIVSQLIADKPHLLDITEEKSWNALHLAAWHGHAKVVAQLLAARPALGSQLDQAGQTAFHKAAQQGHDKVVALMLAHNPELINIRDHTGKTALHLAVCWYDKIVACLLAHGATGVDEKMLWEVLHFETENPTREKVLKLLLAHKPVLAHSVDSRGNTPLHCVFSQQSYCLKQWLFSEDLMRTICEMNPEALRQTNDEKKTPFHVAVESRNRFAIEFAEWKLSLEELGQYGRLGPPFTEHLWDSLVELLYKDVAGTVYDYLFFCLEETDTTRKKRGDSHALRRMEYYERAL